MKEPTTRSHSILLICCFSTFDLLFIQYLFSIYLIAHGSSGIAKNVKQQHHAGTAGTTQLLLIYYLSIYNLLFMHCLFTIYLDSYGSSSIAKGTRHAEIAGIAQVVLTRQTGGGCKSLGLGLFAHDLDVVVDELVPGFLSLCLSLSISRDLFLSLSLFLSSTHTHKLSLSLSVHR